MKIPIWWSSLSLFERLRLSVTAGLLLSSLALVFLRTEFFPFSTYRMYSEIQPNRTRLTLRLTGTDGLHRLVDPKEIVPIGRLHLSYLLNHFVRGNQKAQRSVRKLARGLLDANPIISSVEIVQIEVDRATDPTRPYQFKAIQTIAGFGRDEDLR